MELLWNRYRYVYEAMNVALHTAGFYEFAFDGMTASVE